MQLIHSWSLQSPYLWSQKWNVVCAQQWNEEKRIKTRKGDYKHYYDTPRIKQDSNRMKQILKYVILYLTLSPYDNEQSDFLHRLFLDKNRVYFEKLIINQNFKLIRHFMYFWNTSLFRIRNIIIIFKFYIHRKWLKSLNWIIFIGN